MKNKSVGIFILLLVVTIVFVLIIDYRTDRSDNINGRPFEYKIDEFKEVDPELIAYKEIRQIKLAAGAKVIEWYKGQLFLLGDSILQVVSVKGKELKRYSIESNPQAMAFGEDMIVIAYKRNFEIRTMVCDLIFHSDTIADRSLLSGVAISSKAIYLADAGQRKVLRFDLKGKFLGEFTGISGAESIHGFIVPSAHFDVIIDNNDAFWAVNPGMHLIQNYGDKGELISQWGETSIGIDGFSGCCNPFSIAILSNGNFITAEKGMVRVKEYNNKGRLLSVVAAPNKFVAEGKAPDMAVGENGNIYLLDVDKDMIRVFVRKD